MDSPSAVDSPVVPSGNRRDFLRLASGLLVLSGSSYLTGCGGRHHEEQPLAEGQEGLTRADALLFESAKALPPANLASVTLADGTTVAEVLGSLTGRSVQLRSRRTNSRKTTRAVGRAETAEKTPEQYKREFIAKMIEKGNFLIDRSKHQYSRGQDSVQNGLQYVYGSRDYEIRTSAATIRDNQPEEKRSRYGCCTELLHGLDCSGLIYQCADIAGGMPIGRSVSASTLIDPKTWNNQIPSEWNLRMIEVSANEPYQNGDIIGTIEHVGFIINEIPFKTGIIQSNGRRGCLRDGGIDTAECTKNADPNKRGPRRIEFTEVNQYFTGRTTRLRLVPKATFLVELRWGSQPDMDLHVIEPNGTHVYYDNLKGTSGDLDFDATESYGTEHYKPHDKLADGVYKIGVNYFEGTSPETANIVITAGAETKHYSKTFDKALGEDGDGIPVMIATVRVATSSATGDTTITINPA
ncbi:hypothetical protein [Armatimonas sp.]|uniref:hypothetical protein n=1 Tax=Armatimonas sp. TaxID=1872638 RepID=UPI00374CEF09